MKEFAHDLVIHIEEGHGQGQGHEEEEEGGPKVDCPACGQGQPFLAAGDHYKSCIDELYQSFDARQQKKKILCPTCGKALEKNRYKIYYTRNSLYPKGRHLWDKWVIYNILV